MKRYALLHTIISLVIYDAAMAQSWPYNDPRSHCTSERTLTVYSCQSITIDCAVNGAVMGCLDTLRIITGIGRPQERKNGPQWATLYRRTFEGLEPLDVEIDLVEGKPWANLVTNGGLVRYVNSSTMGFMLRTRCAALEGNVGDSTDTRFTMYPVYRVRTEVRSEQDQSLLQNIEIALPYGHDTIRDVGREFEAYAPTQAGNWTFVKWTSNYPHIIDDATSPRVNASSKCWPLGDTVVLTAWYDKTTLSAPENPTASPVQFLWDATSDVLRVRGDVKLVYIYDINGRLFHTIDCDVSDVVNIRPPRGPWIVRYTQRGGREGQTTLLVY